MTEADVRAAVDPLHLRSFIRGAYVAGKAIGESGKEFPLLPHGVSEQEGEALRDMAATTNSARTLQTGCGFGLSSLFLCEAIAASGRPDALHVVIDPRQPRWDGAGLRAIRQAGATDLVEFHERGAEFVLPRFLAEDRIFDFAFIDGDRRFEGSFVDLHYIHQLVKPGALIVVNGVWMPAVRLAVTYFVNNIGLQIEPVPMPGPIFTGSPVFLREQMKAPTQARMAVLRRPLDLPERDADSLVPFADWSTGEAPLGRATRAARRHARSLLRRADPNKDSAGAG